MLRWMCAAALAAALGCTVAGAAPIEAYGELPSMDDVTLAPDGSRIAYVVPVNGKQAVVVVDAGTGQQLTGLPGTDQKVRNLSWADRDHLLVAKSQAGFVVGVSSNRSEWWMVQTLDVPKHKASPLIKVDAMEHADSRLNKNAQGEMMNVISGMPMPRIVDGHPVVFVSGVTFVDMQGAATLIAIDLERGKQTLVDQPMSAYDSRDWVVDAAGQPVAQITYAEKFRLWTLRIRRGGVWSDVFHTEAKLDTPDVIGVTPDGGSLLMTVHGDNGDEYRLVSLSTGEVTKAPAIYEGFDSYIFDPRSKRVIGGVRRDAESDDIFFDPKDQARWDAILKAFPGEQVQLESWSDDRSKVVVKITGQIHGVAYVLIDLNTRKATAVGDAYLELKPQDVAPVDVVTYKAADGRPIMAYLTVPNGRQPKNLPLIVLPHGGPQARDSLDFDWWAQALASQGYAVLQPQFRGSDGLGWDLFSAGFGEWGRKMQTDVSDGVKALAVAGMIDPKRVCIVGGSYGGYVALAGVTMQSGVYRCAVSYAGVADLHKMYERPPSAAESFSRRFWERYLGVSLTDGAGLDRLSPIKSADKASAPILLIHGKDDSVVPIEQTRRMAGALDDAKKPYQLVILSSEDHWLSRSETRLQMLQATIKFLKENNPPS